MSKSTTAPSDARGKARNPILAVIGLAVFAFLLTAVTGGIWTALLAANLSTSPAVPWAVVAMALLLWGLWRYLAGAGWPRSTSAARKRSLHAAPVPAGVFVWALAAGLLAIVALAGLWIVLFQVAGITPRALPDYATYPPITVALALAMASLVNAVVEEAAFRGYLQGYLQGAVGGVGGIALTALVMAPEHALTQGFVWPTLAFYLAVDAMLGLTAWLCGSILPGIATHALGLLAFFTLVWPGDRIRQLVGAGDAGSWLGIHAAQAGIFAMLAALAFWQLARQVSVRTSD